MDGVNRVVEHPGPGQFAHDGHDPPGPVDILHVVAAGVGGHLAQARRHPGQGVNVVLIEVDVRLLSRGEQVQDRVGRAAHRDVDPHGVGQRLAGDDRARQDAGVFGAVGGIPASGQLDDEATGRLEQALAGGGGGQRRAVAGEGQADDLKQTVHRVGGEHA